MAFLHEVRHRKAVMPEPGRQRDHEPHVSGGQLMESGFVAFILPADGEETLFLPFEKRRVHGGPNEVATNP
jgi:hypothetical protein